MPHGENARKNGTSKSVENRITYRNRQTAQLRQVRSDIELGLEDAPKVGHLVMAGRSVEVIELHPTRTIRRRIFVPFQMVDDSEKQKYMTTRRRRNRGFYKRHPIYYYCYCRRLYGSFDALVRFEQSHRPRKRESYRY